MVIRRLAFADSAWDGALRALGAKLVGEGPMVFLSSGNSHHDIALVKVGDSLATLAEVKRDLDANGVPVHMVLGHRVGQGVYVSDPDGNS